MGVKRRIVPGNETGIGVGVTALYLAAVIGRPVLFYSKKGIKRKGKKQGAAA